MFFEEDGSFSCYLIIDSMHDDQTGGWETSYAKTYLNGKIKDRNYIECSLRYEGEDRYIDYLLYKVE